MLWQPQRHAMLEPTGTVIAQEHSMSPARHFPAGAGAGAGQLMTTAFGLDEPD